MDEKYADRGLGQILSGTARWNNGKNMIFINFQMEKGYSAGKLSQ